MLAEAIQIDGGVVALFLLVLVVLACGYLAYLIAGFRVAARVARPGSSPAARAVLVGFLTIDVLLAAWALAVLVRDPSNLATLFLLAAPAVHGAGYLRGAARGGPPEGR